MNHILEAIEKNKKGIIVITNNKIVYYDYNEFVKIDLNQLIIDEFLSRVSLIDNLSVNIDAINDNDIVIILGDIKRTKYTCAMISELFTIAGGKTDYKSICAIVGMPFKEDIFNQKIRLTERPDGQDYRDIDISSDLMDGLMAKFEKSIFSTFDELLSYCVDSFYFKLKNPSDLGQVTIHENGKSVVMEDPDLKQKVTVSLKDGKSFCEFHQSFDMCIHIMKADLDGHLRKIHDNKEKPELPFSHNMTTSSKPKLDFPPRKYTHTMSDTLYVKCKKVAGDLKIIDEFGDPDIQNTTKFAVMSAIQVK